MAIELPEGYYLDNFLTLLEFVQQQYADLLTPAELAYADEFRALAQESQRLYVRLVSRRGPLFRSDKIAYREIEDAECAWRELEEAGYLDYGEGAEPDVLLDLLTRADLRDLLGEEGRGSRSMRRALLVELVAQQYDIDSLRSRLPFQVLRPLRSEELKLYHLLFFGNLSQDLTEFVLTDLGLLSYEQYPIARTARAFDSREAVDRILLLRELGDRVAEVIEVGAEGSLVEILNLVPPPMEDEMIVRRTDRLLNGIGRQLEREGDTETALAAYVRANAPPSRERRARILERSGRLTEALGISREMLSDPIDEEERELAQRFIPRLERKLGRTSVTPQPPRLREGDFSERITLGFDPDKRVEESVREHFEREGANAFYVENHLFLGLFGISFWDVIFASVRGAFFNRYQSGPADLYSPGFRAARATSIERRFAEIETDECWRARARETYRDKRGTANPFVHWQIFSEELLEIALARIPARHAHDVFGRLLWDLRNHRSGFPDLVVFPREGEYELVEVKGPGDRLQANQKRWMRAFRQTGIPFRVVNVEWA